MKRKEEICNNFREESNHLGVGFVAVHVGIVLTRISVFVFGHYVKNLFPFIICGRFFIHLFTYLIVYLLSFYPGVSAQIRYCNGSYALIYLFSYLLFRE